MTKKNVKKLLEKYSSGSCTEAEKALLESWYLQFQGKDFDLDSEELLLIKEKSWSEIIKSTNKTRRKFSWFKYAAAIVVFSVGLIFYFNDEAKLLLIAGKPMPPEDAMPGGKKATLTLHDGTSVLLDEVGNGKIAQMEGIQISKTDEGLIVYEIQAKPAELGETDLKFNQISTPRGGQYQVILPDGTKVWLNAASSLKYPQRFTGNIRQVHLTGEAYFEVEPQELRRGVLKPFVVSAASQNVEVLGTHFNINSYEDERSVKTTLLEGSVIVSLPGNIPGGKSTKSTAVELKPGQQSILRGTASYFDVVAVKAQESIAWKKGYFFFEQADFQTVMRQLSRWYDLDVIYKGTIPKGSFTGKVHRDMKLSKVFEILAFAQISFKIEGRKIIIFS